MKRFTMLTNQRVINGEIVRYGFTPIMGIEWIYEDMQNGINISYEQWSYEKRKEIELEIENLEAVGYEMEDKVKVLKKQLDDEDWGEEHECDNEHYLIGDWIKGEDGKYDIDMNGKDGYAASTGDVDICVMWSRWTRMCEATSPCAPGAGYLPNIGDYKTFDLPPHMYSKEQLTERAIEEYKIKLEGMEAKEVEDLFPQEFKKEEEKQNKEMIAIYLTEDVYREYQDFKKIYLADNPKDICTDDDAISVMIEQTIWAFQYH
jgi:hypothetical protein